MEKGRHKSLKRRTVHGNQYLLTRFCHEGFEHVTRRYVRRFVVCVVAPFTWVTNGLQYMCDTLFDAWTAW